MIGDSDFKAVAVMKKNLKSILCVAAAAMALASCGVKEITPEVKPEGKVVYFGTEVNDLTKASLTTEDDAYFTANWENNDALEVTGFDRGSHIADFPAVWDSEKEIFAASGDVEYFLDEPYDFIGVYPQPAEKVIDFGSARTQDGNNYAGKYDVMCSNATSLTLVEGETFVLPMDRQTAIAYFHLTSTLPEEEKIVSAKLSVNENLAGSFTYNEGTLTPSKSANSITLSFTNAPSIKDLKLWFNVFPGEYTGLTLEVETENHTLTIQNPNKLTYVAGKLYKVTADATAKYEEKEDPDGDRFVKVSADCDDWSGIYLIVYKDGNDNLVAFNSSLETLDAVNNGEEVTANTDGEIELDETTAKYVFTVASMDGGYSVKASNGKYISGTVNTNTLNANNTPSANTFTWKSDKQYLEVKANTYLTFNNASNQNRFRYMQTDKCNTYLYRLNGKFNPDFPTLTVVDQEVAGSYVNVTIPVTSNRDWTAEITSGAEFVDGGALTTASGSGNGNIIFKFAAANTSYFETQEVTLRVTAETKVADITVTHKAKTGVNLQINGETSNITDNVDADVTQYVANITANFPEWTVLAYSIDDVAQATSGENCVRAYDAEAGTGTVTIKFPSNEATTVATAAKSIVLTVGYGEYISRTITVTQSGDEPEGGDTNGWVKKNFADITADDVFVITSDNYALSSANGTNASPSAVAVTVVGSKITSEVTDALKWTVSGNATDGYTFYAAGTTNALYSNTTASSGSNTNLRVGNPPSGNNRKVFEFATTDGNTTLKTKDSNTARYVCLYASGPDWRGYTSNSTSTNLVFYVYNDTRSSQPDFGFSSDVASYDLYTKVGSYPSLNGALTTVTYTSSEESVATVDADGTVHPKKVGTTVITASTAEDDPNYKPASDEYTLTITDSTPILTLNVNSVNVSADAAANATIPDAYSLQYATDQDVTVNKDGNITAASVSGGIVTYSISANETSESVTSHITLTLNNETSTINVIQAAAGKASLEAPSAVTVGTKTPTTVSASWTAPSNVENVTGYEWIISTESTSAGAENTFVAKGSVSGSSTLTFTKAASFATATTYYVYVRSIGNASTTEPSAYAKSDGFTVVSKQKKTATLTISSGVTSNGNVKDDKNNTWAVSSDGSYTSNNSYIQVGTNNKSVSYLKLSTSAYKDIEKVQVWGTSKANTSVSPKINIDGSTVATGDVYTSQNASNGGTEFSKEFSPREEVSSTLEVEISRSSSANGAIYFNKLIITYYE